MKNFILGAGLVALAPLVNAVPLIDLEVGASSWNAAFSGDIGSTNTSVSELGLDDDTVNSLYVTLELPIPIVPDIRVKTTDLATVGNGTLSADFTFDDQTFNANENVTTDIDLSHTDVTLFYGLPEFFLDVDFGLTLRVFDGEASAITASLEDEVDLSFVIPMAYADVRLNLPLTGLYAGVEANILSVGDNSLSDFNARIGYSTDIIPFIADLNFEAGFRSMALTLEDEDLTTDITIDGPYLGLNLAF